MELVTSIRNSAIPLTGRMADFDPLLERIGDRRFVLIGEASHGTHEFYETRCRLTRRLIEEKGFTAVAIEGDWPDAFRVNRWVRGDGDDPDAASALDGFQRFPRWMWRNTVVEDFVRWLRRHNDRSSGRTTGFYGVDLYSLNASREAVIQYLDRVDPEAARRARDRYSCFDHYGDPEEYGFSAGISDNCRDEAIQQLMEMQRLSGRNPDGEEFFSAEQNARLVRNAEEYYRSMFAGRVSSWNLRDSHMVETIAAVAESLEARDGAPVKMVVWEHNSHLGDARATEMSRWGEWNVGQLMRERFDGQTFLVGFTTYTGTVMAADDWGGEGRVKSVRQGMPGSFEELFHRVGSPDFLLTSDSSVAGELRKPLLERAIGVVYRPETERVSHYFKAQLADQFDAVIHIDQTRAVEPIDQHAGPKRTEVPETFPAGV
jgi:erythromycin esterase-like protein